MAYSFDGTNDTIDLSGSDVSKIAQNYSFSFWIYIETHTAGDAVYRHNASLFTLEASGVLRS